MGLANRITITRGVLALVLWVVFHLIDVQGVREGGLWWVAFTLFVLTAGTDSLDGYVARKRGEVSVFGRIADPFVDKLLVLGSMIFLLGLPGMGAVLPPWVVAVTLARELLVTALRAAVEGQGKNFQASWWGKWKMTIQCLSIGGVILYGAGMDWVRTPLAHWSWNGPDAGPGEWTLARAVCVLAGLFTALSGVEYTTRALRMMRASGARVG